MFPLLLGASTGTLSQGFFHTVCVGSQLDHTHSLASLQWSGLSNQQMLLLTENCLQYQKWSPYKGRGVVSMPVCVKRERNGLASADQGLSRANQDSCHVHGILCPSSPIPPFLLAQKLCPKQIVPTDNKRPKLDDGISSHQSLKGFKVLSLNSST